jgi:flagellar hook-associated protein 1 FlgK
VTLALDSALSGLRVAQLQLNTTSTNIANASSPGYTRKVLPQETTLVGGTGVGVHTLALTRTVDTTLIADLNRQVSTAENYNVRQKYFQRLLDFHGSSDSGRSLADQVSKLAETFTQLSLSPDNQTLLAQTLSTAQQTAQKINDFSALLIDMRTQTEADMSFAIDDLNRSLDDVARLNEEITRLNGMGQNYADLEDQRDVAIKNIAKYVQVTTYTLGKKIFVATKQGDILADDQSHHLYFQKSTIVASSYYPGGGLNGITVGSASGTDITQTGLGGQLGALVEMRDQTLPTYEAQLDEFAQKLADRFQSEGLKLFTDTSGNVPPNVADPGVAVPNIPYVGFASLIKVNEDILADPTLIRSGTTGNTELEGSNEVIRRIAQFTFGTYLEQQATGTVNIGGIGPLTAGLGLTTNNRVTGTVNLSAVAPDLSTLPGATLPGDFDITLGVLPTQTITVLATDTAASLVNKVNVAFGFNVASINGNGQMAFNYNGPITLADNTIGAPTMAALGFNFAVTPPPNPSFTVQVGTRAAVTISINPADTSVELLAALNAVPGLTAALDGFGNLVMTPTDGGDLHVVDGAGGPLAAMGVAVANVSQTSFRQFHMGPDGTLSTGLLANSTLQDYISSSLADQSEAANINKNHAEQEVSFLNTLEARNSNVSGVNIDQEMSELIKIQSAYAAAAKMIAASQKIFEDLLATVR